MKKQNGAPTTAIVGRLLSHEEVGSIGGAGGYAQGGGYYQSSGPYYQGGGGEHFQSGGGGHTQLQQPR